MGMPGLSLGSNPYRVFGGEIAGGATTTLLTVPDDQEFVITMVRASENGVLMMEDGEPDETGMQLLSDGEVVPTGHAIGVNSRVSIAQGDGYLDDALVIGTNTDTHLFGDDRPLWVGKGTLVVPAGSRLQVRAYGFRVSYYIDGEYITP